MSVGTGEKVFVSVASEAVKMRIVNDPNSFSSWGAGAGSGLALHMACRDTP